METKPCNKCLVVKSLSAFSRQKGGKGGVRARCKDCIKPCVNSPGYLARRNARRRKRYADDSEFRAKCLKPTIGHDRSAQCREYQRAYFKANRDKVYARQAVRRAVRTGKMPHAKTLPCCMCQGQSRDYHHHMGYSKEHRLSVLPICSPCHGIENRKK
jgi:hypothetical protein